jgi:hypothetical protein
MESGAGMKTFLGVSENHRTRPGAAPASSIRRVTRESVVPRDHEWFYHGEGF